LPYYIEVLKGREKRELQTELAPLVKRGSKA
jgi:hypothetical protein